jgi:hypothetical protein
LRTTSSGPLFLVPECPGRQPVVDLLLARPKRPAWMSAAQGLESEPRREEDAVPGRPLMIEPRRRWASVSLGASFKQGVPECKLFFGGDCERLLPGRQDFTPCLGDGHGAYMIESLRLTRRSSAARARNALLSSSGRTMSGLVVRVRFARWDEWADGKGITSSSRLSGDPPDRQGCPPQGIRDPRGTTDRASRGPPPRRPAIQVNSQSRPRVNTRHRPGTAGPWPGRPRSPGPGPRAPAAARGGSRTAGR